MIVWLKTNFLIQAWPWIRIWKLYLLYSLIYLFDWLLVQESISPQYQNVGTTVTVATVLVRLDELSRRVASLETGLTADIRRILQLLQAREAPGTAATQNTQPPLKNSLSVPHPTDVSLYFSSPATSSKDKTFFF